ncbi:MAG: proteobacterial dedicated sortase system response regulator [Gammaproteobacteria bacterium]|nr:MAG: proteobacterial dedicated sortase system response regulator [Gammaproteobacteria bacterium]
MARTIAIIEDEKAISDNYADMLTRQGYTVNCYESRSQAWEKLQLQIPDLILLDIGLGDEIEGGFDLCRDIRTIDSTVPIFFLTARDSDFDLISGLRLGADDYLTKDISLPHLSARIAAIFRRIEAMKQPEQKEQIVEHGDLKIDNSRMLISWKGHSIDLTVTEFWMVNTIARHPGHVKSREQLMSDANVYVDDNTITSHIKRIRKKFSAVDADFDMVETVYGMGYRWKTK